MSASGDRISVGCDSGYSYSGRDHSYSEWTPGERTVVGCDLYAGWTPGNRTVVGSGNLNWDSGNRSQKGGERPLLKRVPLYDQEWLEKTDLFTKVFDFITGYKAPAPRIDSNSSSSSVKVTQLSAAMEKAGKLATEGFNKSILLKSFGTSDIMAKRDKSNDRGVTNLALDTYNATQAASAKDWPNAAYYSTEVAKDIIDITINVSESFIESRTEAVKGGYSQYSDIGL